MKNDMVNRHIVHLLKEKSMHITDARIKIIAIILQAGKWISLADILLQVNNAFDRATVYRVLCLLCDNGFLSKLVDNEKTSYYIFSHPGQENNTEHPASLQEHTYFKCLACGSISLLPNHDVAVNLPDGFTIKGSNLLISGYCNYCAPGHN